MTEETTEQPINPATEAENFEQLGNTEGGPVPDPSNDVTQSVEPVQDAGPETTQDASPQCAEEPKQEVATQSQEPRGFEDEQATDLVLPRIELLQGLSAAVTEGKGKPGDIVNQITKSPLATDIFLPIAMRRKYIRWVPRDEGGGIIYTTNNPQDPRVIRDTKWGADGEKPTCTEYLNFLVLLRGSTLPVVLSFCMMNMATGKKLMTLAKMQQADMWKFAYKLTAKAKTNKKGTFHIFEVEEAGAATEQEVQIGEALFVNFASSEVKFDDENTQQAANQEANEEF